MKILTLCGTRPEFIRLSLIIPKLDRFSDHVLVDTGQNYDPNLRDVFFKELKIRKPNYKLEVTGSFGQQVSALFWQLEKILDKEKPDVFLVLGDTNSSLGAIVAKRMGVPVFHMEAGNRCFDDEVPEEVNRRLIDHSSDILLPYTERSRANLIREGRMPDRIFVTGNPINEVLKHFDKQIEASTMLENLELEKEKYFLVTLHRQENVDDPIRLGKFVEALNLVATKGFPVIWSVHPRTQPHLENFHFKEAIVATNPMGLFDFVKLEKNAYCVLTDSGTVQEECCIFGTPVVTLRDSTERPETIETGANFIAGCEPETILRGIEIVTSSAVGDVPPEYLRENVSDTVIKIILGF